MEGKTGKDAGDVMKEDVKIEHGIPIPETRGYMSAIARRMKSGDSVVINWKHIPALRVAMSRMGFKLKMRSIDGTTTARCWMIDK